VSQGIKLRRIPPLPRLLRRAPGSSSGAHGVAELFNINELGEWRDKLRPNFLQLPGSLDEFFWLATFNRS